MQAKRLNHGYQTLRGLSEWPSRSMRMETCVTHYNLQESVND
jgi:hypothetical protein